MLRRWNEGDRLLYRFCRMDGSLGTVHPARVVSDEADRVLCWVLPGTPIRITTSPDGRTPRQMPLDERFSGRRIPARSTWRSHATLRLVFEHEWSSVWWFFHPDGTFRNWYVNLEVPWGRDADGVNRVDGVLDLEVAPDLSWSWKDEDEIEWALRAGRLGTGHFRRLRAEGERLIERATAGKFPFDGTHCDARPDPEWTVPTLPDELVGAAEPTSR